MKEARRERIHIVCSHSYLTFEQTKPIYSDKNQVCSYNRIGGRIDQRETQILSEMIKMVLHID